MDPFSFECFPVGTAPAFAWVLTLVLDGERILLGSHPDHHGWEAQGGHVEPGESAEDAAVREVYEESGVVPATLEPLFDYQVGGPSGLWSRAFVATVGHVDPLPPFEIVETRWFERLPDAEDLTYLDIMATTYEAALARGNARLRPRVADENA